MNTDGLFPIVRRKRRPLVEVESKPAEPVKSAAVIDTPLQVEAGSAVADAPLQNNAKPTVIDAPQQQEPAVETKKHDENAPVAKKRKKAEPAG